MIASHVDARELKQALDRINKKYDQNVMFKRFQPEGRRVHFTLRVSDSSKAGARLGVPDYNTGKQRKMVSACWHVHGDFFDALLDVQPLAVIRSAGMKIDQSGGNWQDWNIGPMIQPFYFSEACEC